MKLSRLQVFPVKSLAGHQPPAWDLGPRGLVHDRHWMVVRPDGRFLTQRQLASMGRVGTHLAGDRLTLSRDGQLEIEVPETATRRVSVTVWRDQVEAEDLGDECADWLERAIGEPCRLVRFPTDERRPVDPAFALETDHTGFADAFPLLLVSEASLLDLNARMPDEDWSLDELILRFRPNLVVSGTEPYAEDDWNTIRIGELHFRVVKPCSRCAITTLDPHTGAKGKEPLKTLASYRRWDGEVFMGQNLLHDGPGTLKVGMDVEIID
ncbi:MAG: MOSC domain-containing protein [Gammaproteobacteria bacterium]